MSEMFWSNSLSFNSTDWKMVNINDIKFSKLDIDGSAITAVSFELDFDRSAFFPFSSLSAGSDNSIESELRWRFLRCFVKMISNGLQSAPSHLSRACYFFAIVNTISPKLQKRSKRKNLKVSSLLHKK
uniref:Uncharacterized protein n=1 Tax=Proboscia inermis TaxID=420281 RepID=A0A7S0G8J4_9STRA|mmetsp:Transcript_19006/g.19260  ORF Transcript_19006/g.19260 Transcript_19006/m.19260 type:complete len:128 (+) Transcript_19006:223-606(+)